MSFGSRFQEGANSVSREETNRFLFAMPFARTEVFLTAYARSLHEVRAQNGDRLAGNPHPFCPRLHF